MSFLGFCRHPRGCSAEGVGRGGFCRRHWAWAAVGSDCAWCGGEIETPHGNQAGEVFCSASHRSASNRARDRFLAKEAS